MSDEVKNNADTRTALIRAVGALSLETILVFAFIFYIYIDMQNDREIVQNERDESAAILELVSKLRADERQEASERLKVIERMVAAIEKSNQLTEMFVSGEIEDRKTITSLLEEIRDLGKECEPTRETGDASGSYDGFSLAW